MKRLCVVIALTVVAIGVGAGERAGCYDVERAEDSVDYLLDRIEEIVHAPTEGHASRTDYRDPRGGCRMVESPRGASLIQIRRRP